MTEFPIALRIKFNKIIPQDIDIKLLEEATEKADEMYFQNKMDLYINFVDEYTTERYFADNAAADEWITFIKDASARNNLSIIDINISNV